MDHKQDDSGWAEQTATALLVLADGTVLEGVGLSEDPTISALLPELRSLTTLSGGGKPLGNGVARFRFVLGLRSGG